MRPALLHCGRNRAKCVSKPVFPEKSYKHPFQYTAEMIPVLFAANPGLLMAGEDPGHVWRTFCSGREDFRHVLRTVPGRSGTECPVRGCHHCAVPGCIYAGFIRQYRNCLQCD